MKRVLIALILVVFLLSACTDNGDYNTSVCVDNLSESNVSAVTPDNSGSSDNSGSDISGGDTLAQNAFDDPAVLQSRQATVSVMLLSKHYNSDDEPDVTQIYRYLLKQMPLSREATSDEAEQHKKQSSVSSYVSNHITVTTRQKPTSSVLYLGRVFEVFEDDCVRWNIDGETKHSVLPKGTYDEMCRLIEEINLKNTFPYSVSHDLRDDFETKLSVYYNVSNFKGYELYARLVDDMLGFTLLPGTNRLKTKDEVDGYPVATLGEMCEILKSYSVFDLEYCSILTFDDVDIKRFGKDIRVMLNIDRAVEATVRVGVSSSTYTITGDKARLVYGCVRDNFNLAKDMSAVDYISDRELYTADCITVRIYDAANTQDVFGRFVIYKDNYAYWLENRDTSHPHYFKLPDDAYDSIVSEIGSNIIDREISQGASFTLDTVTDIINQETDFEVILDKLAQAKPTPDYVGGSGVSVIEYWLDVVGNDKIVIIVEQGEIYHVIDDALNLIFSVNDSENDSENDKENQSETAKQDLRAIADAAILEKYPETDFANFNVRVILNNEGGGSVHYDLLIGGYRSDFSYWVKLSSDKKVLRLDVFGQEYMDFSRKIDINNIKKAELELDKQTQQYNQKSGYYLSIDQDGNLCLSCEIIVEYDVSDEMYGKGCCFDHDHLFFSEIVCYK